MALLLLRTHLRNIQKRYSQFLCSSDLKHKSTAIADPAAEQDNLMKTLKIGDMVEGFVVENIEMIPLFQLTAFQLKHLKTGGHYLHIDRNDSNNSFAVAFRTTPQDSTGLPHILEHTTLTGSEKYPCRDPFFKMLNRSLATFMNAMTGPDFTVYPYSTQNRKDFKNLMSVYLDSVFRPNLNIDNFRQEGWRLEHEDTNNSKTPIIIKGVVFNEMKGVFSNNQYIFAEAIMNNILPSNTYKVCSGGDPLIIPQLTHEKLKKFHRDYYSPSNAKYYSYGNFSFMEHIKYIDREYLKHFSNTAKQNTAVPSERRWQKPVRKNITCRLDPMAADPDKQSSIAVSNLCCEITNNEESFILKVISSLLVEGPNAAFYKTLIEPNIGAGFSPVTGYEGQTRDTYFTVGLQGVSENDFEKVLSLYEETIQNVIKDGFKTEHIKGVLHNIELNNKHQSSDFGIRLLLAIAPLWNHDCNITDLLNIDKHIKNLRENMKNDSKFLQKKVKQYFQENQHKLILTMSPDPKYEEALKEKEEKILEEKIKNLTDEEKRIIYNDGLRLLEYQQTDDKHVLPTLKIEDISKEIVPELTTDKNISGVQLQISSQPTNGVFYFRGLINTGKLDEKLKTMLPLFTSLATKMGTKKYDYRQFDELVTLKTGGIGLSTHLIDNPSILNTFEESVTISTYCLNRNVNDAFDLISEIFTHVNFADKNRFETLIKSKAAALVNGIPQMGHFYAMLASSSLISPVCEINENNGGMTFVETIKRIAQKDSNETFPILKEIHNSIMNRSNLRCAINVLDGTEVEMIQNTEKFISSLSGTPKTYQSTQKTFEGNSRGVFYILPFSVSYASKSIPCVTYKHEDFAVLRILAKLVSMNYLHFEIREKGGAYGSGLSISTSGVLNFFSYRDPNPQNSLDIFDKTIDWISSGKFTDLDVEEAKLGTFQKIDHPVPAGDIGMRKFLYGVSDELLKKHRLELMAVTKDKIISVGEKYFGNNALAGRAVIGPENKYILNNTKQNWKTIIQD